MMNRRLTTGLLTALLVCRGPSIAQIITPPASLRHEGFHPFPTIRTGYPPGTILQTRLDPAGRRTLPYLMPQHLALDPPVQLSTTSEVVPSIEHTTSAGIAAALQMLLPGSLVNADITSGLSLDTSMKVTFGSGTREMLLGADVDRVVAAAVKRGLPAPGSYSVIIGTISFTEVEATMTNRKGGQIDISFRDRLTKVNANARVNSSGTAIILPTKFTERHRAFYMYQVIRPTSSAIAGSDDTRYELVPGVSALDIQPE
jgi:hypothetical protein